MRKLLVPSLAVLLSLPLSAPAAEKVDEAALAARVKALEARVADLEARLKAISERPAPVAPAVAARPLPPAPPPPPPAWRSSSNWAQLKQGMGWSEVLKLLGSPGHKTTGVFGDVWYYPDESGGRIVFDRDSRVAEFNAPHAK